MPFTFRCPHCGHQTEVAEQIIGQSGPCARCGQTVKVTPDAGAAAVAAPRSNSMVWILIIVGALVLLLVGGCVAGMFWAVGEARQAGRRTQDRNQVRQLVIGLHNHHDVERELPRGTVGPAELEPEQQLSWMVQLMPFVEGPSVTDLVDFDQAWDAPANRPYTQVPIDTFQSRARPSGGFKTDFVGIGGLGVDAPTLPVSDARAGVFGYNRATTFGDITDGTSNTIAIAVTHVNNGPWAQGGSATVRGLDTRRPYLGQGGQFGDEQGATVGLADASVRFIGASTDPKVLEALSTIGGGEVMPPY